ncbi:hypothetical protein VAPA_1c47240 [Variovorax paradoxus B4]|uniref:Uncharacterized protein n=1 Tax=Variovorax paradoxus B4 TaxID=1246301 RepID=T1XI21_VARPD|nr:hypothetical protein VAPA_1c47240 [Variovorax paradoxus B4]
MSPYKNRLLTWSENYRGRMIMVVDREACFGAEDSCDAQQRPVNSRPHGRTRTLPSEFRRRPATAASRLPNPKIHSARTASPHGRCMHFLTAPSNRRPPLLLPFEIFSMFGMPNTEK